jgi:ubiquinol-cytochrome c reductase cytochrome b subunit
VASIRGFGSAHRGVFPGEVILGRLYIVHVLLVPALLLTLVVVHVALVFKLMHTQWQAPDRTERNVVGYRFVPNYVSKMGS